ncbi:hypothetical protein DM49_3441 [Burkholderia mallei]|nr:hypothetical protein DO61_4905 [Burkholderia mallei]KOS99594.1 hypothetical protein DM49_3441 [Burkholderia mallei]
MRNGAAGGFCSASMRSSSPVTKRCALGNGASANTRCGARAAFALDASGDFDTAGSAARPQAISAPSALAAGSLRVNERGAPPRAGASAAGAGSARRAEETETGYAIGLAKGVHILEKGGSNGKGGGAAAASEPASGRAGSARALNAAGRDRQRTAPRRVPLGPTTRTISAPNGDSVFEGSNPNEESMPTKVTAPRAQLFLAI